MNRAAKAITARDPLISVHAVRFLMMAGTSASSFLAGFRQCQDGEKMSLWQTRPQSLVARQAKFHNGVGSFLSDADRGRIYLRYWTHQYSYDEASWYWSPSGASIVAELCLMRQRLPETVMVALPGRAVSDVIDFNSSPFFFASKHTIVLDARTTDCFGNEALSLILAVKWHPLSRVLSHLR